MARCVRFAASRVRDERAPCVRFARAPRGDSKLAKPKGGALDVYVAGHKRQRARLPKIRNLALGGVGGAGEPALALGGVAVSTVSRCVLATQANKASTVNLTSLGPRARRAGCREVTTTRRLGVRRELARVPVTTAQSCRSISALKIKALRPMPITWLKVRHHPNWGWSSPPRCSRKRNLYVRYKERPPSS